MSKFHITRWTRSELLAIYLFTGLYFPARGKLSIADDTCNRQALGLLDNNVMSVP